jgi:hypothetical protein
MYVKEREINHIKKNTANVPVLNISFQHVTKNADLLAEQG